MFFALIGEYLTKSQNRGSSADKFLTENKCFIGRMYKKCNDIFEIILITVIKNSCAEKQKKKTNKIMMSGSWKEEEKKEVRKGQIRTKEPTLL